MVVGRVKNRTHDLSLMRGVLLTTELPAHFLPKTITQFYSNRSKDILPDTSLIPNYNSVIE